MAFLASDESNFDYQMKTNERIWKLQEQVNKIKVSSKENIGKMNEAVSKKLAS